jgi:hypothetical protein
MPDIVLSLARRIGLWPIRNTSHRLAAIGQRPIELIGWKPILRNKHNRRGYPRRLTHSLSADHAVFFFIG